MKTLKRGPFLDLLKLEDRTVPASIAGTVFNDLDADGVIDAGESGQSGVTVYIDSNNNGSFDSGSITKSSTNVPVTISASGTPTVTSTLAATGIGTIIDINVTLSITHTWDSDLDIYLTSPAGSKIELSTDNGGNGDNYTNTVFDDEAATLVTAGTAPFTGSFRPEGLLSTFDGQSGDGTWTLTITDDANNDGGTLSAWSITVQGSASGEPSVLTPAAGTYSFTGLAAGTYNVRQLAPPSGQSQTFPAANGPNVVTVAAADAATNINFGNRAAPATISGTAFSDADSDGVFDAGEGVLANITVFLDADQDNVLDVGETSTTTNASGVYTFNNVVPGKSYFVAAVVPGGGTLTSPIRNGLSVLPPVNASKNNGDDNETTVAINPVNTQQIFASSNSDGAGILAMASTNGGASFATRIMPSGDVGIANTFCDPNTAFDQWGNLWMTYLTDSVTVALARSTNGGASFTLVQDFGSADHPAIAIGPSTTPGQQTLAFEFANGGTNVVIGQINAAGAVSFNAAVVLDNSGGLNYGDVAIGPTGAVAVVAMNSSGQNASPIAFNIDPDGSGPQPFSTQTVPTNTNVGGFDYIPAQPDRSVDAEPDLVWDTTGGPNNGRLYLLYTDEVVNEAHDMDIRLRYSDNNGGTWSNFIRVNDDATTNSQFLPRIAMDPTTGFLAVSFYDARNSAGNNTAEYYATASFDGGLTWLPNVKLSTGVSNVVGGDGFDFGDYNDIDFVGGRFVTTWGDNSNSTGDNPNGTAAQDVYLGRVDVANNVKNHLVAAAAGTTYANRDFGIFINAPAPKISSVAVNGTATQRSLVTSLMVTFDAVVTAPLAAFSLVQQGTNAPVTLALSSFSNTPGYSVATFNFTAGAVNSASLADGRYTLTINASQVSGAGGNLDGDGNGTGGDNYVLVGDTTNKLFRLFGDVNGDGTVDGGTDFAVFSLGNITANNAAFDFNFDGTIDGGTDFAEFGLRFGRSI